MNCALIEPAHNLRIAILHFPHAARTVRYNYAKVDKRISKCLRERSVPIFLRTSKFKQKLITF